MAYIQEEKRRDLRVTFRATARLRFPDARVFDKCETSDISVSGVFVQGVSGVAGGDRCEIEFRLVGRSSSLLLEMAGEVVRVAESGVALQFIEVDQDSFCHLQNIVYFNFKEAGQLGIPFGEHVPEVEDESIYLGLDGLRTGKPLPDNYLGNGDGDDDFGDDLDQDLIPRSGYDSGQDD
jgi:hypothetical protein